MITFYMIRHGQTDWNREKRLQGRQNTPMNDFGVAQIKELSEKIATKNLRVDYFLSSPLKRAKDSALIIAEGIGYGGEIIFDRDITERDFGLLEGTVWNPDINVNDPKYKCEPPDVLCERARKAIEKYNFPEGSNVLIVAHGAILSAIRNVLSNGTISYEYRRNPILQGNVLCCEKEDGKAGVFSTMF